MLNLDLILNQIIILILLLSVWTGPGPIWPACEMEQKRQSQILTGDMKYSNKGKLFARLISILINNNNKIKKCKPKNKKEDPFCGKCAAILQ